MDGIFLGSSFMSGMSVPNASKRVIRSLYQLIRMKKMSKDSNKEFVITPAAPRNKANQTPYVKKRKGIPLPEGYTFQDLSKEQRDDYFQQAENKWKTEYNKKRGTIRATSFDVSRG